MIEAVNAAVANASTLRASAEVVSAARAPVDIAPAIRVGEVSAPELPKAPYISPYISMDLNYDKAVLQIRNSDTGDVITQFPSESRLAQLSRFKAAQERAALHESRPTPERVETKQPQVRDVPKAERQPSTDIITVQEVTSAPAANAPAQVAIAAFSAGAQSGQASASAGISVLA